MVADESELVLRYIVVMKMQQSTRYLQTNMVSQLDEYFMKKREGEVRSSSVNYGSARAKRLAYDIDKITKVCEKEGKLNEA